MTQRITVIDYGMGNLRSVAKAVEHVAAGNDEVLVTDDPELILASDRVVFPGQGAARDCMAAISDHHLNRAVLDAAQSKPFLGICMGQQVLLEFSEENNGTELMGLIEGRVRRFPGGTAPDGEALKIPHMGWNQVHQGYDHPLWAGIGQDSRFYFVHSYYVDPEQQALVAATTDYGVRFASAIADRNLFAVQFHPEKSADAGLQLLRNFISWNPT
ncbi:MAG: imidazole glycerol phosphate synthase subunit HisH [Candidatus Thiodiazotropha sp. (ex Lucina aurantia)]|uniref:Imidazole glycerol phosphate synthase subunit HisH n=1 Tax=Candidatus Thiodiazotropha endolucinida TaxID=1655433 RepID=A0A7Z0VQJ2_9GAMM|nr:imidazole glycerol phosphate synthase subunit HisH [Candidatus Thiodiazotropha endolucinida]MBT3013822.1 imidazole glycerol phosphate synthase subunit HisH [Candidatus Thiodiazotropha sp. (ex Lucina pensylvanica)]MBT3018012.1 imidazole glycerol phosphate synthase subunit HisH [Candidatus Thiodiazotropha taylori]MBT3038871.1 imidazole glycerol phosphate synthase subunit HisH [Candidatus Thiodiazotropha sp. (ex Codakia orbicularis)]MBV2105285.1 imidazole glycerol phosphate synthase subunit His